MEKWNVLSSEKIVDNNWITVEKHKCDIGNGTIINDYYLVRKKDYVILVVEDTEQVLFLKQYRHGVRDFVLNLPMGFIDENETAEMAAKRELVEETGYEADKLECLGMFYLAPSYMPTKAYVFYTNKIRRKETKEEDNNEGSMLLVHIPKSKLQELLKKNAIKDASTLTAISMVKDKLSLF